MLKLFLKTSQMPTVAPKKDFRRSQQLLKLAKVLTSWAPVEGDWVMFTAEAFMGHKPCLYLTGQIEKNAGGELVRQTSDSFSSVIIELSQAGLSQIVFSQSPVSGDFLGNVFRSLIEFPYDAALPYLIGQGVQFLFQDPIAWLFMLGQDIPQCRKLIETDLSARKPIFPSKPNLPWQQYQWLQGNFPLPEAKSDDGYAEQMMAYPIQDIEKTESIELLAFRAMQLSVLFALQRLDSIRQRFGFQKLDLCTMETVMARRKQVLSLKEENDYAADEEAFIRALADQDRLTEFEKELQDIRHFSWFLFHIANRRRVEADSRIPGLLCETREAVLSARHLFGIMEGRAGCLLANVRHLLSDVFASNLKNAFELSHPHLGQMLFEDPPKFTHATAQLP